MRLMSCGLWGALALAMAAGPASAMAPKPQREITETKERLTLDEMKAIVAEPAALARADDMPAAGRALDRLLEKLGRKYGADSIEVADALVAFMLVLYDQGREADALAMTPRVLEATRRAWGSDHVEYALLLNDIVQMDYELHRDAVGAQAEPALMEVYRIRSERLGPKHKETISTLIYLGRIQGLRSRTGGALAGAMRAIQTLRRAIAESEEILAPGYSDNIWARNWLADVYARNGALALAMQTFAKTQEVAAAQNVPERVDPVGFGAALEEGGFAKEADAILRGYLQGPGVQFPIPGPPEK